MLDVDIDKLELCPFCGSEAKKHTFDDPDSPYCGGTVIECTKCGATTPVYFGDSDINVNHSTKRSMKINYLVKICITTIPRISLS